MKRIISAIIVLAMLVSMMGVGVYAADGDVTYSFGKDAISATDKENTEIWDPSKANNQTSSAAIVVGYGTGENPHNWKFYGFGSEAQIEYEEVPNDAIRLVGINASRIRLDAKYNSNFDLTGGDGVIVALSLKAPKGYYKPVLTKDDSDTPWDVTATDPTIAFGPEKDNVSDADKPGVIDDYIKKPATYKLKQNGVIYSDGTTPIILALNRVSDGNTDFYKAILTPTAGDVVLSANEIKLEKGANETISITVGGAPLIPGFANFTSEDEDVATVSEAGVVTAKNVDGETTVTVTIGDPEKDGFSKPVKVIVGEGAPVEPDPVPVDVTASFNSEPAKDGDSFTVNHKAGGYTFEATSATAGATITYTVNGTETANPVLEDVGRYEITYTASCEGYLDVSGTVTVTINANTFANVKAMLGEEDITNETDPVVVDYKEDGYTFAVTTDTAGATITYKVDDGEWTATAPVLTVADTYEIDYKIEKDGYTTVPGSVEVTINAPKVYVAEVNGVQYESLEAAVEKVADGVATEIKLLGGIELSKTVTIPEGKEITLNLNGNTIDVAYEAESTTNHIYALYNYGTLTITGGTINTRGILNYGDLTLEDGTTINAIDGNGGYGVRNYNGASFTMNGGTIATTYEDDNLGSEGGSDATPVRVDVGATFDMYGGTLRNICDFTDAIDNDGTTVIHNGTLETVHTTISNSGTLTIEDGSFTCSGQPGVSSQVIYASGGTTTINGGTFNGSDNGAGCYNIYTAEDATVVVSGGTFLETSSSSVGGSGDVAVSGGTFFDKVADKYIADGFVVAPNGDGTFSPIVKPKVYVAAIGEEKFESLEEAVAKAVADGVATEIKLLGNIELNARVDIPANEIITLDLAGHTISGSFEDTFGMIYVKKGAALTVEDSVGEGLITSSGTYAIGNYGTVTLNDGTLESTAEDRAALYNFYYASDYYGTSTIAGGNAGVVWNSGVLSVEAGTVDFINNSGALKVAGGEIEEIYAKDGSDAAGVAGAGTIAIEDASAVNVPDGYKLVEVKDGVYKVEAKVYVAAIGENQYETLEEAVAAVTDDTATEIKLLMSTSGNGIKVGSGKNITFDLNNFSYTVDGTLVGSAGTERCGFQLLKDSNVTFKNGSLIASADARKPGDANKGIAMFIQNYSNLTLEDVTIDASAVAEAYALSNNAGNTVITGATNIVAPEDGVAFDVYYSDEYSAGVSVTIADDMTGKITGKIEYTNDGNTPAEGKQVLTINAGTFTVDTVATDYHGATESINGFLKDGFIIADDGNGSYGLVEAPKVYVAAIGENQYETLEEAVAAVTDGTATEIKLLMSTSGNGIKVGSGKNITFDLNTYSYTVDGTLVGSAGTERCGFQLLKDSNVTFKNGSLIASADARKPGDDTKGIAMFIQNYSNLTLENVTVDAEAVAEAYALSNNAGNTVITGATNIVAPEDGVAFDVYYSDEYSAGVSVIIADDMTGKITGKIEYTNDGNTPAEGAQVLTINAGTFTVDTVATDYNGATASINGFLKDGFIIEENPDGTFGLVVEPVTGERIVELKPFATSVKTGDEVNINVFVKGVAAKGVKWTLDYDETKFEFVSFTVAAGDAVTQTGTDFAPELVKNTGTFADGEMVARYTFKAGMEATDDLTDDFTLVADSAELKTVYEAWNGISTADITTEKSTEVEIVLREFENVKVFFDGEETEETNITANHRDEGYGFYVTTDTADATITYTVNDGEAKEDAPVLIDVGEHKVTYKIEKTGYETVERTVTVTITENLYDVTTYFDGEETEDTDITVYHRDAGYGFYVVSEPNTTVSYVVNNGVPTNDPVTLYDVGTHTIKYTVSGVTGYKTVNGEVTVTINPNTFNNVDVLFDGAVNSNAIITADHEDAGHTIQVMPNVNGASVKYTITDSNNNVSTSITDDPITLEAVGTYRVDYVISRIGYTDEPGSVTVTIEPNEFSVKEIFDGAENYLNEILVNHRDGGYEFYVTAVPEDAIITYKLDGEAVSAPRVKVEAVGRYEIGYTIERRGYTTITDTVIVEIENNQYEGVTVQYDDEDVVNNAVEDKFDGADHTFEVETATPGATITYTVIKDNGTPEVTTEAPVIKDTGRYEITYTISGVVGYEDTTGTVVIDMGDADYVLEVAIGEWTDYVEGAKLVLVYTNAEGVTFDYEGVKMLDATGAGYEYNNTTGYEHVYALVVDAINEPEGATADYMLDLYKARLYLDYENTTATEIDYTNVNDINFSGSVTWDDIMAAWSVVEKDEYAFANQMAGFIKADTNRSKTATAADVTPIIAAVYGNN